MLCQFASSRTALPTIIFLCALAGGCENCQQLRNTPVRSMEWDALLTKCSKCLSPEELTALRREKQRYDRVGLSDLFGVGKTIQEILTEDQSLSAYDPAELVKSMSAPSAGAVGATIQESNSGPWVIPQSVLFLYADLPGQNGSVFHVPDATAFVLCVPHRKDGSQNETSFVRFLVTARHVLDPEWAHCSHKNPTSITIRMNKRAGGVGYETIPLEMNHKRRFLTPADDTSDVAVLFLDRRLIPNLDSYKFIDVPFRLMPTAPEVQNLHTGREIMTAGLLPLFPGDQENLPIFRNGVLSNTPAEPVKVSCDKFN